MPRMLDEMFTIRHTIVHFGGMVKSRRTAKELAGYLGPMATNCRSARIQLTTSFIVRP